MPTRDELLDLFRKSGALLEGHFRLSSDCTAPATSNVRCPSGRPTRNFSAGNRHARVDLDPTVVLSPALGGVIIATVGRALGIRAVFAERQDSTLMLRRGYHAERHRPVLVHRRCADDGRFDAPRRCRCGGCGKSCGLAPLDRGPQRWTRRICRSVSCAADRGPCDLQPNVCPLCAKGLPLVKPGSRPVVA